MKHVPTLSKLYQLATTLIVCGSALFILAIGQLVLWMTERTPPFSVSEYTAVSARPNEVATIDAKVIRQLDRRCSATYSRIFIDSTGVAFDLTEGVRLMTAQALAELDSRNPARLTFKITVPNGAATGRGSVITALEYACNPVHQVYPIPLVLISNIDIIDPKK